MRDKITVSIRSISARSATGLLTGKQEGRRPAPQLINSIEQQA
jgi:hypothetical protein